MTIKNGNSRLDSLKKEMIEGLSEVNSGKDNVNKSKVEKSEIKKSNDKEIRIKRSYMLTDRQIEMVILIKSKIKGDYSDIVGKAIEDYYKKIMRGSK